MTIEEDLKQKHSYIYKYHVINALHLLYALAYRVPPGPETLLGLSIRYPMEKYSDNNRG